MRVIVSADADADLADIILYTRHNWGDAQARKYVGQIDAIIDALAERPQFSTNFKHQGRIYLRKRVGSHAIFARVEANVLTVARILHIRMDAAQHLN